MVLWTLPSASAGLRSALAPVVARKPNLAGEPLALVSLAEEFDGHGFRKPRGARPRFAK
jgi:hypothetical protein